MKNLGIEFEFDDRSKLLYPSQSKTLYEERPTYEFDGQIKELIAEFSICEISNNNRTDSDDNVNQVIKTRKMYSGILGFDLI